jgi:hypothetical protein
MGGNSKGYFVKIQKRELTNGAGWGKIVCNHQKAMTGTVGLSRAAERARLV